MTVQLVAARAFVDAAANIQAHGRSGLDLTYQRLVDGVAADISADDLFFEISGPADTAGAYRGALGAGATASVRTIVVEPAVIAALPLRTPVPFALRDETSDPAITRWDGYILVRGFTAQPA